jgi:two-component system, cell cycle response regulator DivK
MTQTPLMPLVLIVDDLEDNRLLYVECLSSSGFRVIEAIDGKEAIQKATLYQPNAIVLDLVLPDMGGLETLRILKTRSETKHIPVLVLTGFQQDISIIKTSSSFYDVFLEKPCLPDVLIAHLHQLID